MMGYLGQDYYGQYPQAVTQTAPSTTLQTVKLFVDWDGDGTFGGTYDDVTADMLSFQDRRGRDFASNLTGRSSAGVMECTLLNTTGKYSRFNSSSPLFGKLLPGRKIKLMATTPIADVLWTGFLDDIQPNMTDFLTATLHGSGALRLLADQANQITAGPLVGALTSTVVGAILDAAAWPTAQRSIQTGVVPTSDWFVTDTIALQALQEMEDTEIGFLYEGLAHDVVFEARYNRLLNSGTSQASFTDVPSTTLPYLNIEQVDPLREVFNLITATVNPPYSLASIAVLWTLADVPFSLSPGAFVVYTATISGGYVNPWTTPVLGTDIIQTGVSNSDIGLTVTKNPTTMTIVLANNHATSATTISLLQARGQLATPRNPYQVFSVDAASQATYGRRNYPLPSPWYQNQPYAQAACDYFISLKKDPHPTLTFSLPGIVSLAMFTLAVQLRISARISMVAASIVTQLGIGQDFFIESIAHSWAPETGLITTFEVSPASVAQTFARFDIGQFDVDRFAY